MEVKEAVRALLDRLPDDCSVEDVLYHLYVLPAVERDQADVAAVSSTVKDLVAGSGLRFRERGVYELKGVQGAWQLYAVEKD